MCADKERAVLGLAVWLPVATSEIHSLKVLYDVPEGSQEAFI